jgi:archaellum component FlaC
LSKLEKVILKHNKFSVLHPQMFSHLANINYLWLENNTCVDKNYYSVPSMAEVEKELTMCGIGYTFGEQLPIVLNRHERKIESIENQLKKIDGRFESIDQTINDKFASLQTQLEERAKKVDQELEQVSELFAYVYQGNKQNSAEIREIKKTVDNILEMLSRK